MGNTFTPALNPGSAAVHPHAESSGVPVDRSIPRQTRGRAGYALVLIYVFLLFSRLQDYLPDVHLPMMLLIVSGVAALLSGNVLKGLNTKVGLCMLALTGCMIVSIPLSVWRGGAANFVLNRWMPLVGLFFILTALVTTTRQAYIMIAAIAFAVTIMAGVSMFHSSDVEGRLALDADRFNDPNEFAQVLLVGMCLLFAARKPGRLATVLLTGSAALMVLNFFRTGSRGGLIGLLVVLAAVVIQGSARTRIITIAAGIVLMIGAVALAPSSLRARYLYVFGLSSSDPLSSADEAGEESAEARQILLQRSIELTLRNPILGVGTGMFAVAENSAARDAGYSRGMWHDTHNMFTEVSSENGIPAMLLFVAMFVISIRKLSRISKFAKKSKDPYAPGIGRMAYGLRLGIIGFCASGFFLSTAYTEINIVLLGVTMAFDGAVESEFRLSEPFRPRFSGISTAKPASAPLMAALPATPATPAQPSRSPFRLRGMRRPPAGKAGVSGS